MSTPDPHLSTCLILDEAGRIELPAGELLRQRAEVTAWDMQWLADINR